ncbi:MAG TPA: hypothetical protein VJZ27_08865, partial [Aggregatilineales bacterium]|nr:hypothetical protein [Aggregatilineales bacterium]
PVEPVFVIGAVLAVIFIYTENRAKSLFEESVNASLSAGQYGFLRKSLQEQQVTTDQEIVNQLLERIKNIDPDDREVLLIAEALAETHSAAGFESLLGLWPRCSSSQQSELLLLLTEGWPDQRTGEAIKVVVAEALESEETKLRRAALKAMAIYPHLLDTFRVAQYLIDSDPTVNTTAGQLLLQHPSHQLARAAEAQLGWLSKASSSSTRAMAVTAMVNGGVNRFGERVVPIDVQRFQNDRSARVRMSVVPATDYKELIYSACDESPSVRRLAVQRLRRRRRLSTRLLTEHTAKTRRDTPEDFQIYETIRYWHLLTALGKVSSKTEREFLFRELKLGINQIDYISALRHTLKHLQYPPLTPIMTQLSNDRSQLVQAMVNFIGAVFGSDNIDAIVRTIQMEPDKKSNEAAS